MNDLVQIILLASLGSVIALFGGVIFLYNQKLSKILEKYAISLAAGVLITVSLKELLPEGYEVLGLGSVTVAIATFLAAYFFENKIFDIHHHGDHEHGHSHKSSVLFVTIGDTIHNFIDGISIAASYMITPGLGLVTAFSTFLHEVPHEIGDFGVMLKSGMSKSKILKINLLSSLATIVGAVIIYFIGENETLQAVLMSGSAGIFIYLGVVDFLPKTKNFTPFVIGSILVLITSYLVPHGH